MDELTRRDAARAAVAGVAAVGLCAVGAEQASAQPGPERGSAKMLDEVRSAKKSLIDRAELKRLVSGLEKANIKVPRWWVLGTPAIDLILGRVEVTPKQIDELVKSVYVPVWKHLGCQVTIFPFGIPANLKLLVDLKVEGRLERR
jgi:hypothetical protein